MWLRILAVLIKLLKGAVFFVPVSHGDAASQSDGSSQNSELPPPPVTVKLTSIKVYKEDLALLEESVKDAKTHEAISAFKQFKNPMVSRKYYCMYIYVSLQGMYVCICTTCSTCIECVIGHF